jgi:DNA topoisomerase-1
MKTGTKLLIVESPGKLKTLRKILGSGWILEASVGHTTELAHDGYKKLGFDLKEDAVETRYVPRGTRGQQVLSKLRAAARQADQVILAMDPDREGEAIAWHLVEQLRLKRYARVCYTQITESAVKSALAQPRDLDYPLVHAQRARQCLDKLVGYEVSPLLWNTTGGKSAGRVQSATLHLICERERERLAFRPQDYWVLHSHYRGGLIAQYEPLKVGGKTLKPLDAQNSKTEEPLEPGRLTSEAEAKKIEAEARANPHIVKSREFREERRLPLPPLITSSLQQTAGVRFKFSPQKTMQIAQELYEGIGGNGLITYMRTDAITLSPEFVKSAREWLQAHAPEALAETPPAFKVKAEAQGAHEAIRPTSVELTPERARSMLNDDQWKLYKLIWDRAIASQCKPARLSRGQIEIMAGETRWVARGLTVLDPGYLIFWRNIEDEKELPAVTNGQKLDLETIKTEKRTTQPPPRYSEAKLVQLMEKLGIGRPSTYASTIMTLRDREYVELDKGALAPTALGLSTDDVLTKAMPDLVDVKFTAHMEESLDKIAEDKIGWEKFLCDWNNQYLREALSKAHVALRDVPKSASNFSPSSFKKSSSSFSSAKGKFGKSKRSFKSNGKAGGSGAKRAKASTSRRKSAAPSAGPAPQCEQGHGPLESRISKRGDPYFKCATPGCESWAWPKK